MGDEWLARAVKGQAAKEGSPGGGRQGKVARGRSPREGWQGEVGGSFKGPLGDLGLFSRGRQGEVGGIGGGGGRQGELGSPMASYFPWGAQGQGRARRKARRSFKSQATPEAFKNISVRFFINFLEARGTQGGPGGE